MVARHPQNKIKSRPEIIKIVDRIQGRAEKAILTNGCFDIIHPGHVLSLNEACRIQGRPGILIVAINSDDSVRRFKGEGRPINPLAERMLVVAGLESVDYVFAFDEDDACTCLNMIMPAIYCKGDEYRTKPLLERAVVETYGGEVHYLETIKGLSSSSIITRLGEL